MAIPGTPNNFLVQTANSQNLVSWDQSPGATSYIIQRSLDNVSFTNLATVSGSPLATSYIDTSVIRGTEYWYQVAASNISGTSPYTQSQSVIPVIAGEMTLGQIRLAAQQKADRVNSQFVTTEEWNQYINRSMYELYDLVLDTYENYFMATPIQFVSDGATFMYNLPDGQTTYQNGINANLNFTAPPFYKLLGVDLALNNAMNAYVTVNKFNFIDRNRFVYPNTASTIYGVFNLQYRLVSQMSNQTGNRVDQIMFIPTPAAGQAIRIWYAPRLPLLLQDSDATISGINGFLEYVITRAAMYALQKEESPSDHLMQELAFLRTRIEESAANRDAAQGDTVSDTTQSNWANGWFGGNNGSIGGW